MKPRTRCVRGVERTAETGRPTAPVIVPGCNHWFGSQAEVDAYYEEGRGYLYARNESPTVDQAADEIAALEGAPAAAMFSSGMAAISTSLLSLAGSQRRIVTQADLYGGSAELLSRTLPAWGFEVEVLPLDELNAVKPERLAGAGLLYLETPTNPALRLVDLRAVAAAAREAGVTTLVDGTFASPLVQRPLEAGIDLVMHSTTKYLGGHSDLLGGVVAGDEARIGEIRRHRRLLGGVMDAFSAYLLLRGLRTLAVRMEAHQRGAAEVARFLAEHPRVASVSYPGLAAHPDHELAKRQMNGFGGMITFRVAGGADAAVRAHDRLRVVRRAGSLGSVESLASIPARMSHRHLSDEQRRAAGISADMIRLSVGLEDPADLIADLDAALGA